MHAVEFESSIKNGLIQIPQNYKNLQEVSSVRLVVMYDLEDETDKRNIAPLKTVDDIFDKFQIDLSGYKFNRDEANER
jgi:hypothetical protein